MYALVIPLQQQEAAEEIMGSLPFPEDVHKQRAMQAAAGGGGSSSDEGEGGELPAVLAGSSGSQAVRL